MSKSSAKNRSSSSSDERQLAGEGAEAGRKLEPLQSRKPGHTIPSHAEKRVPRLPHEHDESADSQAERAGASPDAELGRQAFQDVERGLVNTDRGLEGDTLVNEEPARDKSKRDNKPI